MGELISGKEALIALANGEDVECKNDVTGMDWCNADGLFVKSFFDPTHMWEFRLKPRTMTINGVEVPAPNYIETDPNLYGGWAINIGTKYYMYKSKKDYDAVIAALHGVLGKK